MEKKRLVAGILVFGSLWGFSECIIGSLLRDANLPAGAIMTGVVAIGLMTASRLIFQQRGMQLGMGLVAGGLRLFNPFGGCFICSAFAIIAEGALFELITYKLTFNLREINTKTMQLSLGIITSYTVYVGGFIITQIMTPLVSSAGFNLENLIVFIPSILGSGLLAAVLGGLTVPLVVATQKMDFTIKDRLYYPTTIGISAVCWFIVIINSVLYLNI
jgi:hypothetical protein